MRNTLLAVVLFVATVIAIVMSLPATAGQLTVQDEINLLPSFHVGSIENTVQGMPFDVAILVRTTASSKDDFLRAVDTRTTPTTISIGIDPAHRYTGVFCGRDLGIDPSRCANLFSYGNAGFKAKDWASGFNSIAYAAQAAMPQRLAAAPPAPQQAAPVYAPVPQQRLPQQPFQQPQQAKAESSSCGGVAFGFLLFIGFVGVLTYFLKRQRDQANFLEGSNVRTGYPPAYPQIEANIQPAREILIPSGRMSTTPATFTPTPIPPRRKPQARIETPRIARPAPQVVVVDNGANDFVNGMIVNELLTNHGHADRMREPAPRTPTPAPRARTPAPRRPSTPKPTYSSGGGGGWDSGGSSGSSGGGGGGGGWDSGDSGGGSSGGGGGDW